MACCVHPRAPRGSPCELVSCCSQWMATTCGSSVEPALKLALFLCGSSRHSPLKACSLWGTLGILFIQQVSQHQRRVWALPWPEAQWLEPWFRFDFQSGHLQEATSKCINKWNSKAMFLLLFPPLSFPLSLSLISHSFIRKSFDTLLQSCGYPLPCATKLKKYLSEYSFISSRFAVSIQVC